MMATSFHILVLPLLVLFFTPDQTKAFLPEANLGWTQRTSISKSTIPFLKRSLLVLHSTPTKRKPSRVTDEDGVTPDPIDDDFEAIDPDDIPELKDIEDSSQMPPGPVPHQPWRRGETNGCEDPITAEWRVRAEDVIAKAAEVVGGKVIDVTWYLTSVLVTIDEDISAAHDMLKDSGPPIELKDRARDTDVLYYDPADPKPDDIWVDDDEIVYQRETEEEAKERKDRQTNMWAKVDDDDPEDEPHIPPGEDDRERVSLYLNEETRSDAAYTEALEAEQRFDEEPKRPVDKLIDTGALSTIAGAIIEALEEEEEALRVLSRHELVLSSPGPPHILETQKQFDAHRGATVIVETQDPWESNRVLKGKLLDRNSMDVLINKKGRMVTIPLNFVRCVRIEPPQENDDNDTEFEYEDFEE